MTSAKPDKSIQKLNCNHYFLPVSHTQNPDLMNPENYLSLMLLVISLGTTFIFILELRQAGGRDKILSCVDIMEAFPLILVFGSALRS